MLVCHLYPSFLFFFLLMKVCAVLSNAGVSPCQDRQTTPTPFTTGHWSPRNHFLDLEAFVSRCPAVNLLEIKFKLDYKGT